MRLPIAAAVLFAVAFTLLFALVVAPAGHEVSFDLDVATWIAARRTDGATAVFHAATALGSFFVLVPLTLLAAAYLYRRDGWAPVGWLAVALGGATALYIGLKLIIERPRPPMGLRLAEDPEWSFPSGHSTQAIVFWTMLAILLTAGRPRARRVAIPVAALIVVLIGSSRIYLGAHWPTDVLGGFALGAAWLAIVLAARERVTPTP